jgi:hypothetical protein
MLDFETKRVLMQVKTLNYFLLELSKSSIDTSKIGGRNRRKLNSRICKLLNDIDDLQREILQELGGKDILEDLEKNNNIAVSIEKTITHEIRKNLLKEWY